MAWRVCSLKVKQGLCAEVCGKGECLAGACSAVKGPCGIWGECEF